MFFWRKCSRKERTLEFEPRSSSLRSKQALQALVGHTWRRTPSSGRAEAGPLPLTRVPWNVQKALTTNVVGLQHSQDRKLLLWLKFSHRGLWDNQRIPKEPEDTIFEPGFRPQRCRQWWQRLSSNYNDIINIFEWLLYAGTLSWMSYFPLFSIYTQYKSAR